MYFVLLIDLDEEENEKEQKRCDEKIREIECGFYNLKEMLVPVPIYCLYLIY